MIFGKVFEQQVAYFKYKLKRKLPFLIPHKWFAWYPVRLDDNRLVWLQNVYAIRAASRYYLERMQIFICSPDYYLTKEEATRSYLNYDFETVSRVANFINSDDQRISFR